VKGKQQREKARQRKTSAEQRSISNEPPAADIHPSNSGLERESRVYGFPRRPFNHPPPPIDIIQYIQFAYKLFTHTLFFHIRRRKSRLHTTLLQYKCCGTALLGRFYRNFLVILSFLLSLPLRSRRCRPLPLDFLPTAPCTCLLSSRHPLPTPSPHPLHPP